jgi:hypothetical protein
MNLCLRALASTAEILARRPLRRSGAPVLRRIIKLDDLTRLRARLDVRPIGTGWSGRLRKCRGVTTVPPTGHVWWPSRPVPQADEAPVRQQRHRRRAAARAGPAECAGQAAGAGRACESCAGAAAMTMPCALTCPRQLSRPIRPAGCAASALLRAASACGLPGQAARQRWVDREGVRHLIHGQTLLYRERHAQDELAGTRCDNHAAEHHPAAGPGEQLDGRQARSHPHRGLYPRPPGRDRQYTAPFRR